jgi:two-component system, chemotaxis family, CheB/CheR fusion protein
MAEVQAPRQLVVIGASAGGIDALSTLVSTLSSSFPAPIILAQHLDPSRSSHLEEILARRSTLPVRTVQDRQGLENGIVYVVQADRHVEITDHMVHVHADPGRARPAPSIDLLLASAAETFGEQLVAVILTGLGSDGADGARRVKERGGTVVIQNPQTATHPEMPLSLAPTTIDIVAELEAIGPLLNDLLAGTYAPVEPDDDRRLRALLEQVRARSGIDFSSYKEPTIRRRLQRRMLDTNSQTLEDYVRYLRRHPGEYDRLANSFLIKVTDFFRDADLFTHLREQILPTLIEEARSRGNELRLWSAGCATGEEAYSLAILASEMLGAELERFSVRIFATDLDGEAVAFARRGVYPSSALKNVPAELRDRYLSRLDSAWEVRKHVRGMVVFGQHDLGQRAPFPRIDLVLCRNVLIYFTPELQRRALQLFAFALREGGYLVLGKAESTSPLAEHFTLVQPRLKVFRRQGERVLIPPSRIRDAAPAAGAAPPSGRPVLAGMERELARVHARHMGVPSAGERAEQVLLELPLGVVVVDGHYDIQLINAAARRLLGIHSPATGEDVIHQAHRELRDLLRQAVDAALNGDEWHTIHELTSLPDAPGEQRYFELSSFVARGHGERVAVADLIVVLIADVTERERPAREQRAALAEAESAAARSRRLLDESTRSVRDLLQANQELAIDNAALRSTNEELLVGNEEAQAAMEEIETLNEEQQATNEELETLNEELQATVEELNATNEDLQARTVELQEQSAAQERLTGTLGGERQRLAAVLAGMSDAVVMVDTEGEPVLTNRAFGELFGGALPALDDASGQPLAPRAHPARRAARGETFTQAYTSRRQDGTRRWFEASGRPVRIDGLTGGVVVIRELSDPGLGRLLEQLVALAGHELRAPLAGLRGSLQELRRALDDGADARLRRPLEVAFDQTQVLAELAQDLADVARLQTGQLPVVREPLDLGELVRGAVELARPMDAEFDIRLEVPAEPLPVSGDRRRLRQLVLSLVAGAGQRGAALPRPTPRSAWAATGRPGVDVRLRREDAFAVLAVADEGPAVAAEHGRPAAAGPAAGVGLDLARAIVSAHDGTIDLLVTDRPGTTVEVRLPLAGRP